MGGRGARQGGAPGLQLIPPGHPHPRPSSAALQRAGRQPQPEHSPAAAPRLHPGALPGRGARAAALDPRRLEGEVQPEQKAGVGSSDRAASLSPGGLVGVLPAPGSWRRSRTPNCECGGSSCTSSGRSWERRYPCPGCWRGDRAGGRVCLLGAHLAVRAQSGTHFLRPLSPIHWVFEQSFLERISGGGEGNVCF